MATERMITIRLSSADHRAIKLAAELSELSMNQFALSATYKEAEVALARAGLDPTNLPPEANTDGTDVPRNKD